MSFMELMENIYETFENEQIEGIVVVVRRIWLRMNDFVFNAILTHQKNVVLHSKQIMKETKAVQA